MPPLSSFLRRLRPAAAPGPAAPAGVPADRAAELPAELAPLFESLHAEAVAAAQVRTEAHRRADEERVAAAAQAEALVAAAREAATAARASASALATHEADRDRADLLAAAEEEVRRVERQSAEAMPELIGRVVQAVRKLGEPAPGPEPQVR